jgi:cytochrome c553
MKWSLAQPLACAATALILGAPAIAAAAEGKAAAKPDLAKGQVTATAVCGACHTSDGSRGLPANPILAGQHADCLVKQLTEFKAGKRQNAIMNGMAAALSEDDVRNVAAYFSGKSAQPGAARNKDSFRQGERIWRGGIAEKKVPACAGCHGPSGTGIPAQFPRLAGQHREYLESQMTAFRSGGRANSAQMTAIAANLSDAEIKAVADYAAGLQ